jgi:hypothetical protein
MGASCSRQPGPSDDETSTSQRRGGVAEDVQPGPFAVRWQGEHGLGGSHARHKGKLGRVVPSSGTLDEPSPRGGARVAWEAGKESNAAAERNMGSSFSCEQLLAAGFSQFSSATPASKLPAAGAQPLAFLALETAGGGGYGNKRSRNRLVPLHVNTSCQRYFKIGSTKVCGGLLYMQQIPRGVTGSKGSPTSTKHLLLSTRMHVHDCPMQHMCTTAAAVFGHVMPSSHKGSSSRGCTHHPQNDRRSMHFWATPMRVGCACTSTTQRRNWL